jgi:rsbT co-antagonist protein RsbR
MPSKAGKDPVSRKNSSETPEAIRIELVKHFRTARETLRHQWVQEMTAKGLLEGLSPEETESESQTIYDTCINCLESGTYQDAEIYASRMAARGVLKAMSPEQILGGMLTLRDVYGRSLFQLYQKDMDRLTASLEVYEPVANKILAVVALAFIKEREKVVSQQQEAIRELSTPVLQLRDRLLILPIVGVIDSIRARQLTEQLLKSIRATRAQAVVIDITGVPIVDSKVANHLVQTVEASRLMGASVIVSGISPEIAQTLVTIGVDLSRLDTVCDLQGGVDRADAMVGLALVSTEDASAHRVSEA